MAERYLRNVGSEALPESAAAELKNFVKSVSNTDYMYKARSL